MRRSRPNELAVLRFMEDRENGRRQESVEGARQWIQGDISPCSREFLKMKIIIVRSYVGKASVSLARTTQARRLLHPHREQNDLILFTYKSKIQSVGHILPQ
ncbi:MAG: hypothetical protein C4527_05715 [Candidatus Omnitrophota bacterium]|nr:MAG: hypothetical protein C4527_05715 [Candidatus Omnitrophota bacterium]